MKRNTALRLVGWLAVFGLGLFGPLYRSLSYQVWAEVASFQGGLKMPATTAELHQFMELHPDEKALAFLIVLGILIALSVLIGAILVALFGEAKSN